MGGRTGTSDRGQSETIGVVLLLAMAIMGATVVVALGGTALQDARESSRAQGTEHALTQLDSRAAMVALGDSDVQTVDLSNTGGGRYEVDPDAGWINISHFNHTEDSDVEVETLFNATMGQLVYRSGGTVVAYQGGGVWRGTGRNSTMVSPPELHYRASTLTLPLIRVSGTDSAAGRVRATISVRNETRRVFPNESASYDEGGAPYANPIRQGNVTVTVHSQYYRAWASYFRSRTDGSVTEFHNNDTVRVNLLTFGTVGDFEMPADGNAIDIRGFGTHSLTNYTIILKPDDTDSADFANLQWTMYADKGNQEFEIHLRQSGKNDDVSTDCTERDVSATVYYSDQNGDPYHGWFNDTAFRTECYDNDGDGDDDETMLVANLSSENVRMSMKDLGSSHTNHFNPSGATNKSTIVFDEHSDVDWEPKTFDGSGDDDTTIGNLTNHYLSLMGPNVELTVEDKGSDTVNEDASQGTFDYDSTGAGFITFLHITENRIEIELD